jgi:hypothetical protein
MSVSSSIWSPDQELIIKYRGLIDVDGLYRVIYNWFDARKLEWHEPNIKDKHPMQGDEQEIKIRAYRNDTEFMRVVYDIYIHTWDLTPVHVVKDGVKKTLEKGRLKVTMNVSFEFDYENRWESSRFHKSLRDFYIQNIMLRKILAYGDKIEYEAHNLHETMKQWLEMQAKGNQFADMY